MLISTVPTFFPLLLFLFKFLGETNPFRNQFIICLSQVLFSKAAPSFAMKFGKRIRSKQQVVRERSLLETCSGCPLLKSYGGPKRGYFRILNRPVGHAIIVAEPFPLLIALNMAFCPGYFLVTQSHKKRSLKWSLLPVYAFWGPVVLFLVSFSLFPLSNPPHPSAGKGCCKIDSLNLKWLIYFPR